MTPSNSDARSIRVGSVVIDCNDITVMVAFWRDALGYAVREPADEDFVLLRDPAGRVDVSLQLVPERRRGKNRLHLDLSSDRQADEVHRLLALGATRAPRTPEAGDDFVLLEDPEGNVFCVVDTAAHTA